MWNSLKVSVTVTILSVLITTTTAFAFSRFRFYGRGTLLKGILLIQVFPAILAMVAIFALVQQLGSSYLVFRSQHAHRVRIYLSWRGYGHQYLAHERIL